MFEIAAANTPRTTNSAVQSLFDTGWNKDFGDPAQYGSADFNALNELDFEPTNLDEELECHFDHLNSNPSLYYNFYSAFFETAHNDTLPTMGLDSNEKNSKETQENQAASSSYGEYILREITLPPITFQKRDLQTANTPSDGLEQNNLAGVAAQKRSSTCTNVPPRKIMKTKHQPSDHLKEHAVYGLTGAAAQKRTSPSTSEPPRKIIKTKPNQPSDHLKKNAVDTHGLTEEMGLLREKTDRPPNELGVDESIFASKKTQPCKPPTTIRKETADGSIGSEKIKTLKLKNHENVIQNIKITPATYIKPNAKINIVPYKKMTTKSPKRPSISGSDDSGESDCSCCDSSSEDGFNQDQKSRKINNCGYRFLTEASRRRFLDGKLNKFHDTKISNIDQKFYERCERILEYPNNKPIKFKHHKLNDKVKKYDNVRLTKKPMHRDRNNTIYYPSEIFHSGYVNINTIVSKDALTSSGAIEASLNEIISQHDLFPNAPDKLRRSTYTMTGCEYRSLSYRGLRYGLAFSDRYILAIGVVPKALENFTKSYYNYSEDEPYEEGKFPFYVGELELLTYHYYVISTMDIDRFDPDKDRSYLRKILTALAYNLFNSNKSALKSFAKQLIYLADLKSQHKKKVDRSVALLLKQEYENIRMALLEDNLNLQCSFDKAATAIKKSLLLLGMAMKASNLHQFSCRHTLEYLSSASEFLTQKLKAIVLELRPKDQLPVVFSVSNLKRVLKLRDNTEISDSLMVKINTLVRQVVEMLVFFYCAYRIGDSMGDRPHLTTSHIISFYTHNNQIINDIDFDSYDCEIGHDCVSDLNTRELKRYLVLRLARYTDFKVSFGEDALLHFAKFVAVLLYKHHHRAHCVLHNQDHSTIDDDVSEILEQSITDQVCEINDNARYKGILFLEGWDENEESDPSYEPELRSLLDSDGSCSDEETPLPQTIRPKKLDAQHQIEREVSKSPPPTVNADSASSQNEPTTTNQAPLTSYEKEGSSIQLPPRLKSQVSKSPPPTVNADRASSQNEPTTTNQAPLTSYEKEGSLIQSPPRLNSQGDLNLKPSTSRGLNISRARQRKAMVSVYLKNKLPPLPRNNIEECEQIYKYGGFYLSKNSKPRPSKCYLCGISSSNKVIRFENIFVPCSVDRAKSVSVVLTVCLLCFKAINIMALSGHKDLIETQLRSRVSGKYRHPLLFEPLRNDDGSIVHNTRCFINEDRFSKWAKNTRIIYNINDPNCLAKIGQKY